METFHQEVTVPFSLNQGCKIGFVSINSLHCRTKRVILKNRTVARAFSSRWAREPNATMGISDIPKGPVEASSKCNSFVASANIW